MFSSWILADIIAADKKTSNIPEIKLSDDWEHFEVELGKYKREYVKTLASLKIQEEEVNKLSVDINAMTTCMNLIQNKDEMKSLIEDFKMKNDYTKKKEECLETAGKIKSMQNVLVHTNASRYEQFTCSVCMDRLVDTFLDPCGHVICRTCHVRSMSSQCPICRTSIEPKKIYSTM
jgi:Asp-tRNA(Asn)/Glu-tRNA(Gln) amidotransferase C subunit